MKIETLSSLCCPVCHSSELNFGPCEEKMGTEILWGDIVCGKCKHEFPIFNGIGILAPDFVSYFSLHFESILAQIPWKEIPKRWKKRLQDSGEDYSQQGMAQESVESFRVNSLYYINHFLSKKNLLSLSQGFSSLVRELINRFWDHSPEKYLMDEFMKHMAPTIINRPLQKLRVIDLACNVGGALLHLEEALQKHSNYSSSSLNYLGIDTSFTSIALARHLYFGAPFKGNLKYQFDLNSEKNSTPLPLNELKNSLSKIDFTKCDFVIGDVLYPPVRANFWDVSMAMNIVDMLPEPELFIKMQAGLMKKAESYLLFSSPYAWGSFVSKKEILSRQFIQSLYAKKGLMPIFEALDHEWLFVKQDRQIECYSNHLMILKKCH